MERVVNMKRTSCKQKSILQILTKEELIVEV